MPRSVLTRVDVMTRSRSSPVNYERTVDGWGGGVKRGYKRGNKINMTEFRFVDKLIS